MFSPVGSSVALFDGYGRYVTGLVPVIIHPRQPTDRLDHPLKKEEPPKKEKNR